MQIKAQTKDKVLKYLLYFDPSLKRLDVCALIFYSGCLERCMIIFYLDLFRKVESNKELFATLNSSTEVDIGHFSSTLWKITDCEEGSFWKMKLHLFSPVQLKGVIIDLLEKTSHGGNISSSI